MSPGRLRSPALVLHQPRRTARTSHQALQPFVPRCSRPTSCPKRMLKRRASHSETGSHTAARIVERGSRVRHSSACVSRIMPPAARFMTLPTGLHELDLGRDASWSPMHSIKSNKRRIADQIEELTGDVRRRDGWLNNGVAHEDRRRRIPS